MKKILLSAALIAVSFTSFAQVGVGTTSPEGALDVVSTDNGFLMPRMADEAAVTTPVEGMQVYNTTTDKVMLYDGTEWVVANTSAKWVDDASGNGSIVLDLPTATDSTIVRSTGGHIQMSKNYLTTAKFYDADTDSFLPSDATSMLDDLDGIYNTNRVIASDISVGPDNGLSILGSTRLFIDSASSATGFHAGTFTASVDPDITNDLNFAGGVTSNASYFGAKNLNHLRAASSTATIRASSSTGYVTNSYGVFAGTLALSGTVKNAYGVQGRVIFREDAISETSAVGGYFLAALQGSGSINNLVGVTSRLNSNAAGTSSVNNAYVVKGEVVLNPATTVSNLYGLYLQDIEDGTSENYAIYTNAGKIHFGGLEEYADQTAATTAGLVAGDFYHTAGTVKIVY